MSRLAAAVARIGEHEWPVRLTPTVRAALTELAALHGIDDRIVDAPGFDVDELLAKLGPAAALVEPTVRNSANPTMLDAGYKVNVIPGQRHRLSSTGGCCPAARTSSAQTLDRAHRPRRRVGVPPPRGRRSQAPVDSPTYAAMRAAVEQFDPDGHVVPYCMSGGTDAKQFSRLGITGYGFSPLKLPEGFDYQALFHGVDERVPVEALHFGVRVLDRFLRAL